MTTQIGSTTVFTSRIPPDPAEFERRMALLLRGRPHFVWVKNEGSLFYHWELASLYIDGDMVTSDFFIGHGGYRLLLKSGGAAAVSGNDIVFGGDGCFRKSGASHRIRNISLNTEDGTFSFTVNAPPEVLAIGLAYYMTGYDAFFRVPIVKGIFSPLLQTGGMPLHGVFDPLDPERSLFTLTENVECTTCFTTIYGQPVRMKFPPGFRFVMQPSLQYYEPECFYLSPSGKARVITAGKLMPGLSGAEYIECGVKTEIVFEPGQPGYYGALRNHPPPRTSYIHANGLYFAQPKNSFFYLDNGAVRPYAELPGATIPDDAWLPAFPFPMADGGVETAARLETEFLAPCRRKVMEMATVTLRANETEKIVSTRHGLRAAVSGGRMSWLSVAAAAGLPEPYLALTTPSDKLMLGFEANDLFLAIASEDQLSNHGQTPFRISDEGLALAVKNGYDAADAQKLRDMLAGRIFLSEEAFRQAVETVAVCNDILRDACDNFIVDAAGWRFTLSPRFFDFYDTVMVIKLHSGKSVAALAETPAAWSFAPDAAGVAKVKRVIHTVATAARELANPTLNEILYSPGWCGTVYFHAGIEIKGLPDELGFFAEGIRKPEEFKALFLAFPNAMPEERQGPQIAALVDYRDELHLYSSDYRDYDFKLLRMQMEIRNNAINYFFARVELLVNRLFGGKTTADENDAGNNLLFGGVYQQDEQGVGRYVFSIERPQTYHVDGCALATLTVEQAAMQTGENICRFVFGGCAALYQTGEFDLFSYSGLIYRGLTIEMRRTNPGYSFRFLPQDMRFLTDVSVLRENSLAAGFPVTPRALVASPGAPVKSVGYTRLQISGVPPADLSTDWYGILWDIEIGDLGGLAAGMLAKIELLTAWSAESAKPVEDESAEDKLKPRIFAGLRFGAAGGDEWSLPLQGVLSLGFDAIELHHEKKDDQTRYFFQFKNFAVKLLGLRFPYTANDMFLVSDNLRRIGWYGSMEG